MDILELCSIISRSFISCNGSNREDHSIPSRFSYVGRNGHEREGAQFESDGSLQLAWVTGESLVRL